MNADLVEDRIRLDAVDPQGAFQAIWFTRRLITSCLPHFAAHAEKQVGQNIPADLALSLNQQQLLIQRTENPIPPVQANPSVAPWLCRTVHLTPHNRDLIWIMCDDQGAEARIALDEAAVRAVLDVFLTTYRALAWEEDMFPQWVREASAAPANPAPRVLN